MTTGVDTPVRWWRVWLVLIALFGAVEIICRIGVGWYVGRPFDSFDAYSFSGYGVYRQNPRYTHPAFEHNAVGFRNTREFSIAKPKNTFRVMTIGASVLYAGSAVTRGGFSRRVRTDETISAYLEPLLREMPELAGYDVEVINPSVNRHNLRHTLAYYVAELARYDPDVVVVFGTHNDSAYLELVDAMSTLFYDREDPTPEERRVELLLNDDSISALAEKGLRVVVNRSAAAATAYRVLDRGLKEIANRINVAKPRGEQLATPEQIERHVRYYLAALDSLLSYIETQGAEPVVFWEYLLLMVDGIKPLSDYERAQADFLIQHTGGLSEERKRLKFEIHDRVVRHLERRGIPLIDLLDDFRDYSGEVFNDYLHYSAEGNRWVAGRLAVDLRPIIARRLSGAGVETAD